LTLLLGSPLFGQIVISQLYGGGGNAGASYQNDYIELFNRGSSAVRLDGWSVQYAAANGDAWDRTILSGSIVPGQYFLVQERGEQVAALRRYPTLPEA
jgi:predicted extracellular nuclease